MKSFSLEGVLRRMGVPAKQRAEALKEEEHMSNGNRTKENLYDAVGAVMRAEKEGDQMTITNRRDAILKIFQTAGVDLNQYINPDVVVAEGIEFLRLALTRLMVPHDDRNRAVEVFTNVMTPAQHDRAAGAAQEFMESKDMSQERAEMKRRLCELFHKAGFDLLGSVNRSQAAAELAERSATIKEQPTTIIPVTDTTRVPPTEAGPDPELFAAQRTVFLMPNPATQQFSLYSPQAGRMTLTVTYDDGTEITTEGDDVMAEHMAFATPAAFAQVRSMIATVVRDGTTVAIGEWQRPGISETPVAQTTIDQGASLSVATKPLDDETAEDLPFIDTALRIDGSVATVVVYPETDGLARIRLTMDDESIVTVEHGIIVNIDDQPAEEPSPKPKSKITTDADPDNTRFNQMFEQIVAGEAITGGEQSAGATAKAPVPPAPTNVGIDFQIDIPAGRTVKRMDLYYLDGGKPISRSVAYPPKKAAQD